MLTNVAKASVLNSRLSALARAIRQTPELREAYASLYSGLQLGGFLDSGNVILVTSAQPDEGKTTVAAGLSIIAALAGQSTLLIDGDLRRHSLTSATEVVASVGFGDVLDGQAKPEEAVYAVDLFEHAPAAGPISLMVAGDKSPAFLPAVDWPLARATLHSFAQHYDLVLVDTPPVLAANDALLLSKVVDAVLLVVRAGSAEQEEVRRVKDQIEATGTPMVGAVLNIFDSKSHGRSNHPYRSYYSVPGQ